MLGDEFYNSAEQRIAVSLTVPQCAGYKFTMDWAWRQCRQIPDDGGPPPIVSDYRPAKALTLNKSPESPLMAISKADLTAGKNLVRCKIL